MGPLPPKSWNIEISPRVMGRKISVDADSGKENMFVIWVSLYENLIIALLQYYGYIDNNLFSANEPLGVNPALILHIFSLVILTVFMLEVLLKDILYEILSM